jgi:phosphate transport system permease protein
MTATPSGPAPGQLPGAGPDRLPGSGGGRLRGSRRGRLADPMFRALVTSTGVLVLVLLAFMIIRTTADSWPIFAKEGFGFFTGTEWDAGSSRDLPEIHGSYGAWPFMYGTLVTSAIALLIALPVAVAVALYLTQLAPRRLRTPLSYAVETLAAVPSIVYGLWGLLFLLPAVIRPVMGWLASWFGDVFLFEGPVFGLSYFAAGIVLAIMVLPIMTAIIREVFAAAPTVELQAAYGLGATQWEVIRKVLVPRSYSGIIGGAMLGLGRAIGETVAVAMLVGGSQRMGYSLFFAGDTMAAHIFNTFKDAVPETVLGLTAIGVALFVFTFAINVLARLLVWRVGRTTGDAAV